MTTDVWTSLHSFDFLDTIALSIKGSLEDELAREPKWTEVQSKANIHQQYLLAFVESDHLIHGEGNRTQTICNLKGWLIYFARGGGEMFNEFLAGITEVGDIDMRKLIIKSVKTIEHPTHWQVVNFQQITNF